MGLIATIGRKLADRLVYRERVDSRGRALRPRPVLGRLTQVICEAGITTPWMMSAEECVRYWSDPGLTNTPASYATKATEILDLLARVISPPVATSDSILELGCNAGTNLDYLRRRGFASLGGVEISAPALAAMAESFPETASAATLYNGSFEQILPTIPSDAYDLCLTMAVCIHIHPSSRELFREMVRVARRYICIVESEVAHNGYVFPRNYRRVFERLGCRQIAEAAVEPGPGLDDYVGYTIRLFATPGSSSSSSQSS